MSDKKMRVSYRLHEAIKQLEIRGSRVATQAANDGIGTDLVKVLDAARRFATLTSPVTWDDEAREDIRFAVQGTKVDTSEAAVIDETIDAMLLFLSGGLTYE